MLQLMRRIRDKYIRIFWILILTTLISGCISSDLVNIHNEGFWETNTNIENGKGNGEKVGVPTQLIREYGYYFLSSNGFSLEPLICEFDREDLEIKYLYFVSELGKTMSKLLLNIKLTNSIVFKAYTDIFKKMLGLEHIRSNYDYFLEIEKMYVRVNDLKINESLYNEEIIESEIQSSLGKISEIISRLSEQNKRTKEEEFCVNLYLFRFKSLKQTMLVVSGFLSSILGKQDSVTTPQLEYPQFNQIFDLITRDTNYLTAHKPAITKLNLRFKAAFQGCLETLGNIDIPLFGGDDNSSPLLDILPDSFKNSLGNGRYKRSAGKFGTLLDELAEKNIYRAKCESIISGLMDFVKSLKIVMDDSLRISKAIMQNLVSTKINSEINVLKYSIFKEYSGNMMQFESLFNKMGDQIGKESLRSLLLFVSEFQFQLQQYYQSMIQIFDFSQVGDSLLWWDNYFNLGVNDNIAMEKKLTDLSKILNIVTSLFNKISLMESKVMRVLSLEKFSRSLKNSGLSNVEYVLGLISHVQTHSRLNIINKSYLMNYVALMDQGLIDSDTSHFMHDLSQSTGIKRSYDDSCEKLKTYFKEMASNSNIREMLYQADRHVFLEVQRYRWELGKLYENKDSANILFIVKIGNIDQYQFIVDLIENLILGETQFEEYVTNYLEMRSCMGEIHFELSQLTAMTPISRETPELRIFLDPIRNKLLSSRNDLLIKSDDSISNEMIQIIDSTFEMYLLAQLYFPGSLSQAMKSKEIPESPLGKDDINLVYDSIVRTESFLFKNKSIKPFILSKDEFSERVSFLYSAFISYVQQISNLSNYLKKWKEHILKSESLFNAGPTKFINLLNSSLDEIANKLIQMFNQGSLSKNVEKDILEQIEKIFFHLKSKECTELLSKLDTLFKSESLLRRFLNGSLYLLSQKFIDEVKSMSVLDGSLRLDMEDKMSPWDSQISASKYPESIFVKKAMARFSDSSLGSGCNVAYLDRIGNQNRSNDNTVNDQFDLYNVIIIHCKISNAPGETIIDFLKRRALIKDSGSVTLPGYLANMIDNEFYISYLAVDFSLANSLELLSKLEAKINKLFILIPNLRIDYFLNLDALIISGSKVLIDLNKDLLRKMFSSLITNDSELGSSSLFLYKSKVLTLELPVYKNGKCARIQTVGKYSGFGGETPVCFAIVMDDFQEFRQDSSILLNAQNGLFQKEVSNYVPIYKNFAPLNTSYGSVREFVWIVSERSHVLYMLLLRNEVEKIHSRSEELSLIYPVAEDAHGQLQISYMNAFFNSIARRKDLNNLFYDVIKNKLFILSDSGISTSHTEVFSEFVSETQLFINLSYSPTHVLDVPIYESEISHAIDSYISGSIPRFCSSRRNYSDNSIVLNINEHFSLQEMISYRLLLNVISPTIKLKVRNLPSQNALRKIFNIGKEYLLDFERLRLSYIFPIKDINDKASLSIIRKNIKTSLEKMIRHTTYSQLSKFTPDISSNSIGYNIVVPTPRNTFVVKNGDEIFHFNGKPYFVVRYSEHTFMRALSDFLREVISGRVQIIFAESGLDLNNLNPSELPSVNNYAQIHLLKGIPIELVPNERLIRIYTNSYETEDMELVHNIISIYQGFDLSIVTKCHEYYYFYLLCWNLNDKTPRLCSYVQVFRYLRSNIFEKLKLYQISLNRNISLSAIAEEGEILSLDSVGQNVISRFDGSILYKGDKFYELYYHSEHYWDMCSFAQEFFKFSSELPIRAINFDASIKDIVLKPNFSECPIPAIPNLINDEKLPHFVTYRNGPIPGFIFTLYNSIRYQTLSVYINFFLSKKKLFIKHEGIEHISTPESIFEILSYFDIDIIQDTSVVSIRLNEISLRHSEIQSAKIVANQIKSIIPNSAITGINTRREVIF